MTEKAPKITEAWLNFITYCRTQVPHCEIKVKIVNGEPTHLVECKPVVRFDKTTTIPKSQVDE